MRLRPTGAVGLITRPKKYAIGMFFYRAFAPHQSRITKKKTPVYDRRFLFGAADEARTRYLHLGKVALYQMSYSRILYRAELISAIFIIAESGWIVKQKMKIKATPHRKVSVMQPDMI